MLQELRGDVWCSLYNVCQSTHDNMTKMKKNNFEKYVTSANPIITYVISNHLWLEHLLVRCLIAVLPNPEALFRSSRIPRFPLLVDLCEAHDIIASDFANVLRKVNALRNKFAHRIQFEPDQKEVEALLRALREMEQPFLLSSVPASERELAIAFASINGYLERCAREIGATDIGAA